MSSDRVAAVHQELMAPISPVAAHELAVEQIKRCIQLGLFLPGEKLPPERMLAERLSVSRSTLREAVRQLQEAGFLSVRRGAAGGLIVHDPHAEDPAELRAWIRTGSTGEPVLRAKPTKPRCQRPSRTPRRPSRETSPAGNTITHCSCSKAWRTERRLSAPGRPPRIRIGSNNPSSGRMADSRSLATIRTSRRTLPTSCSSASASSAPDG